MAERKDFIKENKATWFRQEGATATLMVPWTPDSALAKGLRKVLESTEGPKGTKVKIVEKPGLKVTAMVQSTKNFKRLSCGRLKCPLKDSEHGCRDTCFMESVIYMGQCNLCVNTKSIYIGETSRTIYTRANQHLNDFVRSKNRGDVDPRADEMSSWIMDHVREKHSNEHDSNNRDIISFSVLSNHRDPFTRQTVEAVRIQQALDKCELRVAKKTVKISSLNRKGEFFAAKERWDSRRRVN